jgi:hypothetical protein
MGMLAKFTTPVPVGTRQKQRPNKPTDDNINDKYPLVAPIHSHRFCLSQVDPKPTNYTTQAFIETEF